MRKLREVLRLSYSANLSIREISASTKISAGSIQNILKRAVQLKITWPLPEDWDDLTTSSTPLDQGAPDIWRHNQVNVCLSR